MLRRGKKSPSFKKKKQTFRSLPSLAAPTALYSSFAEKRLTSLCSQAPCPSSRASPSLSDSQSPCPPRDLSPADPSTSSPTAFHINLQHAGLPLFLTQAKLFPASGPSHWLFPLPGTLFPTFSHDSLLSFTQVSVLTPSLPRSHNAAAS